MCNNTRDYSSKGISILCFHGKNGMYPGNNVKGQKIKGDDLKLNI